VIVEEHTATPSLPPAPRSMEDTGLNRGFLTDLVLKWIYVTGEMSGQRVANEVCLPFMNIVEGVLDFLKHETFIAISGGGTYGEQSLEYRITERGAARAREAMLRSQYVGPAPVPLATYARVIKRQSAATVTVRAEDVRQAFSHLVLPKRSLDQLGPAINSGRSLFIYGSPGGGKTTIAEAIADVLGGAVCVPYAVDVDGHIIKVYDAQHHRKVEDEVSGDGQDTASQTSGHVDRRWLLCRRPAVIVGGELTLDALDLVYDPLVTYYEAPLQMKANGGMMLIDDFGRQQVRPVDLLNRWMVPLEKRIDFLTLHTGQKIDIPFDALIVFSTNLEPKELVDEAFLRRIRHKIEIGAPTVDEFRQIMQRVCEQRGIPFEEDVFQYMLEEWYEKPGRELRGVHPRDIVEQLRDITKYTGEEARMTSEAIDQACRSYFVPL